MKLWFVSAPGGSAFMEELLDVVCAEVAAVGVDAEHVRGPYPDADEGDVFVVVPHEYFVVLPASRQPTTDQRNRTVAFAVEHPGTETFEVSAALCAELGAVVDINVDSARELHRRGVRSEHFQLGYTPLWDRWHGAESFRPVDVTYMGTTDPRRARALGSYAEALAPWNVQLLMPPHEPMTKPRPDFLMADAKFGHLAMSRLLLNLHRGASRSFEWVRALEAICNGCVVVSEHSPDHAPLVPGEHAYFGAPETLGALTDILLRHPERIEATRKAAYAFVRSELTMVASARRLCDVATSLINDGPWGAPASAYGSPRLRPKHRQDPFLAEPHPPLSFPAPLRHRVVELVDGRRPPAPPAVVETAQGPGPGVDVLVAGTDVDFDGDYLRRTLAMVEEADASSRVIAWSRAAGGSDPRIVCVGGGRPARRAIALNAMLAACRTEFVLVLEPGAELLPGAVERLSAALRVDDGAAAAYPMVRRADGAIGNALPFEPERLCRTPYLGATALWRLETLRRLGGWDPRPLVDGLEDHALWCRVADAGLGSTLVAQVLAVVGPAPSPVRTAEVYPHEAHAAAVRGPAACAR